MLNPRHDDISALLAGDKVAWTAFVARHADSVHWTIRRVLAPAGAEQDVADVFQDVFVRLHREDFRLLRRFDAARASLATYVKVIARTAAIDALRRRRPAISLEDAGRDALAVEPDIRERIKIPPDLLSPRQRLVVTLLYDREWDVRDVAAALGIDPQTVRSTHHKALTKLRQHFRDDGSA